MSVDMTPFLVLFCNRMFGILVYILDGWNLLSQGFLEFTFIMSFSLFIYPTNSITDKNNAALLCVKAHSMLV